MVIFYRFPRDNALAKEWTKAIKNVDFVDKPIGGMVCIDHFSEEDFKRKDRNVVQLKPGSIPTILIEENASECVVDQNSNFVTNNNDCCDHNEMDLDVSGAIGCDDDDLQNNCSECSRKDQQLSILEKENQKQKQSIIDLRKTIKSLRDKTYYLEDKRKTLKEETLSLKKQSLQNEEFRKESQVYTRTFIELDIFCSIIFCV